MDILSELVDTITVIKEDSDLKEAFVRVLEQGSYSQQERVSKLAGEIFRHDPPDYVMDFLMLLKDDKIANLVYAELVK